jgi:hypothetical protein
MMVLIQHAFCLPGHAASLGLSFQGTTRSENGIVVAGAAGAAGPQHLVELLHGRYAVFDKSNGELITSRRMADFWADAGVTVEGFAFDPRIVYDAPSGRWFAAAVDNPSAANHFLLAVSNSQDPTDGWRAFRVQSDPDNHAQWADYTTLGVDGDGVYVAADMFDIGGTIRGSVTLLNVPKSDLVSASPSVARGQMFVNRGDVQYVLQPAVNLDGSGHPLPLFSIGSGGIQSDFTCSHITGPPASSQLTPIRYPRIDPLPRPTAADQPAVGGPAKADIYTSDTRFSSSIVLQDGAVWGVHGISVDGRAAVRWFEVSAANCSLRRSGVIADPELALYYPSIAVNEFGDVVIGMNGSSSTQPISSYAIAGKKSASGETNFGPLMLLKAGIDDYEGLDAYGRNRWADYSSTVVDPSVPYSFWTFQQVVIGDNDWATHITQILVDPRPGDINRDGVVDRSDVAAFALSFAGEALSGPSDLNSDGAVNLLDAALLQADLDSQSGATAVPEPANVIGAAGMALLFLMRGRPSRAARGGWLFGRACGWRPGRPRRFGGRR